MKMKKAVSVASNIIGFFTYSVAVTVVKKDADECEVYVDVHGKFSDELTPFLNYLTLQKLFWSIQSNGLLEIYDNQTNHKDETSRPQP
jgi:hypothetical protein